MLARVSSSASPPNFSSTAEASTWATTASPTTPPAGTAQASVRCVMATAGSPVRRSTVLSGRGTVEKGFIAARRRMGWPVAIPPSMPPARAVARRIVPPGPATISSCAFEPGRRADANPSPTSTPLTDWIDIRAAASCASSLRSAWT